MVWCFYTHCADVKNSALENIWEMDIVGRLKVQPTPKYSYQVALSLISKDPPTEVVDSEEVLNRTSLVDKDAYLGNFNGDNGFEEMEILAERYGIVLMATCVAIPVVLSWLRFLPLPQPLISKFYAIVIDPPLFKLVSLDFPTHTPLDSCYLHAAGMLAFCHLLQFYLDHLTGEGAYAEESKLDYWTWGIMATLALVLLIPLSILPLRQKMYEAFLASHIQWGYQTWIWITFAFWIFDRFLARPSRLVQNGVKRATVAVIDEDYLQLTIPRVEAEGHRFWENHPFSVAKVSSSPIHPQKAQSHNSSNNANEDENKVPKTTDLEQFSGDTTIPGLVIFVRRHTGLTSLLSAHANSATGIPVLVEGSYGPQASILPSPAPYPTIEYPNIICVAGGVGVIGVLSCLDYSPSVMGLGGKKKLFWGVRTEPLVQAARDIIPKVHHGEDGQENWNDFDVSISVGKRFDLDAVLKEELGSVTGGTTVVVCGPSGMADEVGVAVTELGKGGCVVRLIEESFAW
ncbi:hypothetical protein N0V84_005340 [Fusarium piperis]|uniref:Ferric oxidoreductase domain-containing protein n=1 Tax=Fusarium piperis TaxID=1435070 RepID=A0A9W9BQN9_9HYPO|nr:hypothetical protein N0V84_005340 [Fusarium piperis]